MLAAIKGISKLLKNNNCLRVGRGKGRKEGRNEEARAYIRHKGRQEKNIRACLFKVKGITGNTSIRAGATYRRATNGSGQGHNNPGILIQTIRAMGYKKE